ncbi:hypothetical protein [Haloferax profundi]|uniref:DUF1102 domain-containing protein n=1 Tax=Haloferax profundi TaxID=1544718 RepID=A0A0W1SVA4_9EURY|nr:hypothetical protein [Haloferax profundi]KTG30387.1 hypothetical protein AUR66_08135 [Haloferax profundi]
MGLNRRNVLLGLGGIVGGGGALVGTGAFSSVSAARTVKVSTTGDASAFLQIEPGTAGGAYLNSAPASEETVTVNLNGGGSGGFNKDAITTIDGILTVTNNSADDTDSNGDTIRVGLSDSSPSGTPTPYKAATITVDNGTSTAVAKATFYVGDGNADASTAETSTKTLGASDSASIGVKIDTTDVTNLSGDSTEDTISLVADDGV